MNMHLSLASSRWVRLLLAVGLLLPLDALAETQVYVTNFRPFWYEEDGQVKGVTFELMRELQKRVGNTSPIQPVPPKREMAMIKKDANSVGIIFWQPDRESSYKWMAKLLDERVVLVTCVDSKVDISTVEAARNLRVGVVLGGPSEVVSENLGFKHIDAIPGPRSNGFKLALGRVDAVAALSGVALYMENDRDKGIPALRIGATLEPISLYLVAAANFDPEQAGIWRSAFDAMRRDGTYVRILGKYHYGPGR